VGQPKRLEELTQQSTLNYPTVDLLQLAQAVVTGLSDCFTAKDRELNNFHKLDSWQGVQPCAPTTNLYFT
jgi:hypothetical protein